MRERSWRTSQVHCACSCFRSPSTSASSHSWCARLLCSCLSLISLCFINQPFHRSHLSSCAPLLISVPEQLYYSIVDALASTARCVSIRRVAPQLHLCIAIAQASFTECYHLACRCQPWWPPFARTSGSCMVKSSSTKPSSHPCQCGPCTLPDLRFCYASYLV